MFCVTVSKTIRTDMLNKPRPLPPLTNDTEGDGVLREGVAVSYYQRVRPSVAWRGVGDQQRAFWLAAADVGLGSINDLLENREHIPHDALLSPRSLNLTLTTQFFLCVFNVLNVF